MPESFAELVEKARYATSDLERRELLKQADELAQIEHYNAEPPPSCPDPIADIKRNCIFHSRYLDILEVGQTRVPGFVLTKPIPQFYQRMKKLYHSQRTPIKPPLEPEGIRTYTADGRLAYEPARACLAAILEWCEKAMEAALPPPPSTTALLASVQKLVRLIRTHLPPNGKFTFDAPVVATFQTPAGQGDFASLLAPLPAEGALTPDRLALLTPQLVEIGKALREVYGHLKRFRPAEFEHLRLLLDQLNESPLYGWSWDGVYPVQQVAGGTSPAPLRNVRVTLCPQSSSLLDDLLSAVARSRFGNAAAEQHDTGCVSFPSIVRSVIDELSECRPTSVSDLRAVDPGHPLHAAVIELEQYFPNKKLPRPGKKPWQKLLDASRNGEASVFDDHADQFEAWLQTLVAPTADLRAALSGDNPTESQLSRTKDKLGSEEIVNSFRYCDEAWQITYSGRTIRLKDQKGLWYIAELIRNRKPITAIRLVTMDISRQLPKTTSTEHLPECDSIHSSSFDGSEIADEQALGEYRQAYEDYLHQLDEAKRNNDPARIEQLQRDMAALAQQIEQSQGLGNRKRKSGSEIEKARLSTTNCIDRAVAAIKRKDPALGAHLEMAIQKGRELCYRPSPEIDWIT